MTEPEWAVCQDQRATLEALRSRASGRKLRLLACVCCADYWSRGFDVAIVGGYRAAELFADGRISEREREASFQLVMAAFRGRYRAIRQTQSHEDAILDAQIQFAAHVGFAVGSRAAEIEAHIATPAFHGSKLHPAYIRDIFGNPFRPVTLSPEWRTDTAVALARQMYESRDFGAMPILADALQDAGCDDEDVLSHCRDPEQVHARGCWVVDLVLGKQ